MNDFSADGNDVTLLMTFSGGGHCLYKIADEVKVVSLFEIARIKSRNIFSKVYRLFLFRKFIVDLNPDVIVSFLTNVNIATLLACYKLKFKVIVSERSYPPARNISKIDSFIRQITYPWATRVVLLTSDTLSWLNDTIPLAKWKVIPNPVIFPLSEVAPFLFPKDYVSEGRKLVLAVGRVDQGKQFEVLIKSFSLIAKQYLEWDLIILGEGELLVSLKKLTVDIGLSERIFMPGNAGNVGD